jgi:hypothetical protein
MRASQMGSDQPHAEVISAAEAIFAWSNVFEQDDFSCDGAVVFTKFSPSPSLAWKIYSS